MTAAEASTEELSARLGRLESYADDWVSAHIDWFDPLEGGLDDEQFREKVFSELAIYLDVVQETEGEPPPDLWRLLVERVNDPRFYKRLRRDPHRLGGHAAPIATVEAAGRLCPATRHLVDRVLARGDIWAVQRPPYAELALWHFCERYDHMYPAEPGDLARFGSLSPPPNPVTARTTDAYAFTHDLLYLHRFGTHETDPLNDLKGVTASTVDGAIRGLILRYFVEGHFDLLLECLVVGALQGSLSLDLVDMGLARIEHVLDEHGQLPRTEESLEDESDKSDGGTSTTTETRDNGPSTDEDAWREQYHTTLLLGMVTRLLRQRLDDFSPLSDWNSDRAPPDQSDHLRLGIALENLSDYQLKPGAEALEAVMDRVTPWFPYAVESAVEYIRLQRGTNREDFGWWGPERALHQAAGGRSDEFNSELLDPVIDACERVLTAYDALDEGKRAGTGRG